MNEFLLFATFIVVLAIIWWVSLKPKPKPEEDEHAQMVKPRDKHGRWVKECEGLVVKKNTPWNRGRK